MRHYVVVQAHADRVAPHRGTSRATSSRDWHARDCHRNAAEEQASGRR